MFKIIKQISKYIWNLIRIAVIFPVIFLVIMGPVSVLGFAFMIVFELTTANQLYLAGLLALGSYFAFVTLTQMGERIGNFQVRTAERLLEFSGLLD